MFQCHLHKSGLLITVSKEELEARTSGSRPDGGPYLPTVLILGALNSKAWVTDTLRGRYVFK